MSVCAMFSIGSVKHRVAAADWINWERDAADVTDSHGSHPIQSKWVEIIESRVNA